jgi:hypothetical protein
MAIPASGHSINSDYCPLIKIRCEVPWGTIFPPFKKKKERKRKGKGKRNRLSRNDAMGLTMCDELFVNVKRAKKQRFWAPL